MTKIKMSLTERSIDDAIKQLTAYRDSLQGKIRCFVEELLDLGITTAEEVKGMPGTYGTHKMENFVTFSKQLDPMQYGYHGIMLGVGTTILANWFGLDGEKRKGSINALLAIEFGTAIAALPATNMFGGSGGRGTNSKYGHSDDSDWYFIEGFDAEKRPKLHHATAITPTRPMFEASQEMLLRIEDAAKRAFKT